MALVTRSVLVGHSAGRMFGLVQDVERYPEFLPWCAGAEIEAREGERILAALVIDFKGIRQRFATENTATGQERIEIKLARGPFRQLDGDWRFTALGEAGCRIDFRLHYEFSSKLLEKLVGPVFTLIAGSLVDAFLRRADALPKG